MCVYACIVLVMPYWPIGTLTASWQLMYIFDRGLVDGRVSLVSIAQRKVVGTEDTGINTLICMWNLTEPLPVATNHTCTTHKLFWLAMHRSV